MVGEINKDDISYLIIVGGHIMPIKSKRDLICKNCGKSFTIKLNDAIMPKDLEILSAPLCKKCELLFKLSKKNK